MPLAQLLCGFQSLLLILRSKLGPSGADSWVGGFVYILGVSNELSCKAGSFSHCHNPHRFLQPEVLRLSFPTLEPWVAWSVSLPSCSSWFICMQMWDHLLANWSSSHHLAAYPLCHSCPSLSLLLVWMNVSFLTPWLLDFHTVHFPGISAYFLFLNYCPFGCPRRQSVSIYASILWNVFL